MKPSLFSAVALQIHRLDGATRRLVHTHRRIAMPVAAMLALLLADHVSRPVKEAPGKAENPASSAPGPETRPSPSPAIAMPSEPTGIDAVFFNPHEHSISLQHQAMLEQAVAAEQAQMLRFQQLQLQRESELRAMNAELRARQAADHEIRRYQEDIAGHLHSILGE